MKFSRKQKIVLMVISLFLLLALGFLGSQDASLLGDAAVHVQHFIDAPLFRLGGMPINLLFLFESAIFLVLLALVSHTFMLVLQKRVLTYTPLEPGQQYAVARVLSYLLFALGLVVGLQSLGLNLNSLVVVGGALGLGVGLGLQAVVANFVAGLILLFEQPVKLGDRIQVGDTYGDIVQLRGRSTWVRTNDNVVIIVPNSDFINQKVINWTANDRQVRIAVPFGVSYSSNPVEVRDITLSIAGKHPDVLLEPAPEVIFLDFGDSSLDFELRVWTITQVQTPLTLKSDLYFAIFDAFGKANIELPFPQRDLHLRTIAEPAAKVLKSMTTSPPR
ncbi:MAG TPA: mechanosensitive ion channel domain-containing protein [Acidobacteriaceae bacterium]|nr:mechanosensitive ion channel domain-containing protein [Acidobacteriaceae bacterium]